MKFKSAKTKVLKINQRSVVVELSHLDLHTIMKALNLMRRTNYRTGNPVVENEIPLQKSLIQSAISNGLKIPPYTNKDYWEME